MSLSLTTEQSRDKEAQRNYFFGFIKKPYSSRDTLEQMTLLLGYLAIAAVTKLI